MFLRGIDTNLVVALSALLRHRNVTRAGKEVGLTQSSMSHALARLRAHFGDPLLVSVGRELVLTDLAKQLVGPVGESISQLERVFARPEPFDPATSERRFRIAATDNLELYVLPRLAEIAQKTAPGVSIRTCSLPAEWESSLLRGDIDLKLGRRYPVVSSLSSQTLSRERLSCVVRARHPVRGKLTLERYASLGHLVVSPTAPLADAPKSAVDVALEKRGMRRRVVMTVEHFLVAPFIVASSDLVLTAPERLIAPFAGSLGLRRLDLPVKLAGYELSQVWAARSHDDAGHRWLREQIAGVFAA